ncbi:hypothetical protein [Bacillus altitudinis]|uniref:hypothetical protein n=1 Tax=Bacillus altitudinis TaxID=293387 RepID=UPI001643EB9D|nr:hypothetical protein [Bacillus altitudinis]
MDDEKKGRMKKLCGGCLVGSFEVVLDDFLEGFLEVNMNGQEKVFGGVWLC